MIRPFVALSQESAPDGFEHWSAGPLQHLQQTLKTEAAANRQHLSMRRLRDYPNDLFMLSDRQRTESRYFVVQSGSVTLLVGGMMVGGDIVEPHEKRNGTIQAEHA
jgi:hypothetical protein